MLLPVLSLHTCGKMLLEPGTSVDPEALKSLLQLAVCGGKLYLQTPADSGAAAAAVPSPPAPTQALISLFQHAACWMGPFSDDHLAEAAALLDKGASVAVFQPAGLAAEQLSALTAAISQLPHHRVAVQLPGLFTGDGGELVAEVVTAIEACAPVSAAIILVLPAAAAAAKPSQTALLAIRKGLKAQQQLLLQVEGSVAAEGAAASLPSWLSVDAVGQLHRAGVDVLAPASIAAAAATTTATSATSADEGASASASAAASSSPEVHATLDPGSCFAACARTDRTDGLYTTVVCDASGKALGLVYSSKESLAESVRCMRGVYFSRSRGGLWRKGDTSGAWQDLLKADLDCDSDAVRFLVHQHGQPPAFCHLNTRSCWGELGGLGHLELVLEARKKAAPVGSYTKRLFEDATLLRNKLLEEAQELSEAAESGDKDHTAAEAADLIYFALTACAKVGVSVADIERQLDWRALKLQRRPGNAKAERIAAAAAILGGAAPPAVASGGAAAGAGGAVETVAPAAEGGAAAAGK